MNRRTFFGTAAALASIPVVGVPLIQPNPAAQAEWKLQEQARVLAIHRNGDLHVFTGTVEQAEELADICKSTILRCRDGRTFVCRARYSAGVAASRGMKPANEAAAKYWL